MSIVAAAQAQSQSQSGSANMDAPSLEPIQRLSQDTETSDVDLDLELDVDDLTVVPEEKEKEPPLKKQKASATTALVTKQRRRYTNKEVLVALRDPTMTRAQIIDRVWPSATGQQRKNRHSQVRQWEKRLPNVIIASMKIGGMNHKAATAASNMSRRIFIYCEEKQIYNCVKLYFDTREIVNKEKIMLWARDVAAANEKSEKFKSGDAWFYWFLNRWGLSLQRHSIRRSPSVVSGFSDKRDKVWNDFLYKVLRYQIKLCNIWNIDQNGQHYMMYPDKIIAPVGMGQLFLPGTAQSSTKKRFTVTMGVNALGQLGYVCITFKERYNYFGPFVLRDLQADPNTEYVWLQASTSGTQKKCDVRDYAENVLGREKEMRLFILDDLSSWSSDDNVAWLEEQCNCKIVSLPGGMTAFIQICDTALFKLLVQYLKAECVKYLEEKTQERIKNKQQDGNVPTRPRGTIIQQVCNAVNYATSYQERFKTEYVKTGYTNCLDETEDDMIHQYLHGKYRKQEYYKNTTKMPKTAEERLQLSLGGGRRQKVLGTNEMKSLPEHPPIKEIKAKDLENPLTEVRDKLKAKHAVLFKNNIGYFAKKKKMIQNN
eukprot:78380_1